MHSQRDWLRPWRWFHIPVSVQSFDWRCIRALIVPTIGLGGAGAPRMDYALRLVQTDVPNGTRIVASFGVGIPSADDGGAEPAALWEHLRRFMQEDGPHLEPHDALYVDDSSPSRFWHAIWWWQPLLGPGAKQFWAGPYWFLTIPFGLVALIGLPLTMTGGLYSVAVLPLQASGAVACGGAGQHRAGTQVRRTGTAENISAIALSAHVIEPRRISPGQALLTRRASPGLRISGKVDTCSTPPKQVSTFPEIRTFWFQNRCFSCSTWAKTAPALC